MNDLPGKVALVPGAGSGIGKAVIAATGGEALALTSTFPMPPRPQAIDHYGQFGIVVANTGINGVWAPIENLESKEWDKTIAINLRGTYLTINHPPSGPAAPRRAPVPMR